MQPTHNSKKIIQDLIKEGIVNDANTYDVTEASSQELGDFIKQNIQGGFTCIVYSADSRILVSVNG